MRISRQTRCQIIYVTNQDKKDVVYVIVIFSLTGSHVLVVLLNSEQNLETKDYGIDDVLLWTLCLREIIIGT